MSGEPVVVGPIPVVHVPAKDQVVRELCDVQVRLELFIIGGFSHVFVFELAPQIVPPRRVSMKGPVFVDREPVPHRST